MKYKTLKEYLNFPIGEIIEIDKEQVDAATLIADGIIEEYTEVPTDNTTNNSVVDGLDVGTGQDEAPVGNPVEETVELPKVRTYEKKVIVSEGVRVTNEGKEVKYVRLEDGSVQDLTDEQYALIVTQD